MGIVFNPSPIDEKLSGYPLKFVKWLLLNEIERHTLTIETDPLKILGVLGRKYPSACIVLTLGTDGVYCI